MALCAATKALCVATMSHSNSKLNLALCASIDPVNLCGPLHYRQRSSCRYYGTFFCHLGLLCHPRGPLCGHIAPLCHHRGLCATIEDLCAITKACCASEAFIPPSRPFVSPPRPFVSAPLCHHRDPFFRHSPLFHHLYANTEALCSILCHP